MWAYRISWIKRNRCVAIKKIRKRYAVHLQDRLRSFREIKYDSIFYTWIFVPKYQHRHWRQRQHRKKFIFPFEVLIFAFKVSFEVKLHEEVFFKYTYMSSWEILAGV